MPDEMIIIIDTREQLPYRFWKCVKPHPKIEFAALKTGDYSLKGFEDKIVVERKTIADAYNSFVRGRTRFEKELERMQALEYAAVVIEGDWLDILRSPPIRSKVRPKSIYASIIAWEQRYGVSFWPCPNRAFARKTTYRILERYWRDTESGRRGAETTDS
jgi:ERCC4-type nuclease